MTLTCIHMTCGHADCIVLRDVTLSIERGTITALVGLSGAGKSTLLEALHGGSVIQSGSVVCDGTRGFVRQNPEKQLFAETAFQDVAFGPTNQHLGEDEVCKRVEMALNAVDIAPESAREKSPFAYSGGEQRRIAIAGILAMRPDYLLLDEPTAGLDTSEVCRFWRLVHELTDSGCGIVVSTHDLVAAQTYADRILIVAHEGVLVWEPSMGSVAEVVMRTTDGDSSRVTHEHIEDTRCASRNASPSFAASLDPRTKIIACMVLLLATVLAQDGIGLFLVVLCVLGVLFACRITPQKALHMLRPFAGLLLGVLVFDVLFTPGNTIVWSAGALSITVEGITFAIDTAIRFIGAFLIAGCLRFCADSTEIADGFRMLSNPLRRFGVSVDEIALSLSITFRFIPIFQEEYHRVVEAQTERGACFHEGSLVRRAKAYSLTLTPLSISAIRRAIVLAQAMENRSFIPGTPRTCLRTYRMQLRDVLTLIVSLAVLAAVAIV